MKLRNNKYFQQRSRWWKGKNCHLKNRESTNQSPLGISYYHIQTNFKNALQTNTHRENILYIIRKTLNCRFFFFFFFFVFVMHVMRMWYCKIIKWESKALEKWGGKERDLQEYQEGWICRSRKGPWWPWSGRVRRSHGDH